MKSLFVVLSMVVLAGQVQAAGSTVTVEEYKNIQRFMYDQLNFVNGSTAVSFEEAQKIENAIYEQVKQGKNTVTISVEDYKKMKIFMYNQMNQK